LVQIKISLLMNPEFHVQYLTVQPDLIAHQHLFQSLKLKKFEKRKIFLSSFSKILVHHRILNGKSSKPISQQKSNLIPFWVFAFHIANAATIFNRSHLEVIIIILPRSLTMFATILLILGTFLFCLRGIA